MRAIADAAAQPESEEIAVANALAVLQEKLGWRGTRSPHRRAREFFFMLASGQKSWSRMASVRRHSSRPYSVQMPSPQ